jgi:hypothetical protein
MSLSNQIKTRLEPLAAIRTLDEQVLNDIVRVGDDSVVVRSSRTNNEREISYDHIRNYSTMHGSIIDAFRRILGLDGQS